MRFLKRRKSRPPLEFVPADPLESLDWLALMEVVRKAVAHVHEFENREKAYGAIEQVIAEMCERSHRLWIRELKHWEYENEINEMRFVVAEQDRRIRSLLGEPRGWQFGPGCCGPYGYLLRRWKEEKE